MANEIVAVISAIEAEAKKWRALAGEMETVKSTVDGLYLGITAFALDSLPASYINKNGYEDIQSFMTRILGEAAVEFDEIGGALDKIAAAYDRADAICALDLEKIYSKD